MADILLLEPGYANKYPPIGLMKISYFHKHIHRDYVRFAKGKLPDAFKDKKWDRVYVTTLFTFEWPRAKAAIEYAISVAKDQDPNRVYTGGILATLMPTLIKETFPSIHNNTGLLDKKGTLGLEYEECVDRMTLDYSILDDIGDEYVYPAHDAYFTYMTRGCGMKCAFCAVQTLEPEYYPYISIKDTIKKVNEEFGPKKDLLLMDNNVLRSPKFDQIIDEIIELGYGKGAEYKHPKTGRMTPRYVDFNQGLDAFLLTPHKAARLGELNIRPARIAFDHVEDTEKYKEAIRLCANNGIDHMSNYLLYNGEDFTGKGHSYRADTPEDLYERMRISMELQEELVASTGRKITIFSFPMRYIPLSATERGFVGTHWNKKYLRALQRMLIPTQGKGVSSRSFFEADFGKSKEEFVRFLAMPEEHLGYRGIFIEKKKASKEENAVRRVIWEENQKYLTEWNRLYDSLEDIESFKALIGDNKFIPKTLDKIVDPVAKKLYIHYLTKTSLIKVFIECEDETKAFVREYICKEFPVMYKRMLEHIINSHVQKSLLNALVLEFKASIIRDVFARLGFDGEQNYLIEAFKRVQLESKLNIFDCELVKCYYLYRSVEFLTSKDINQIEDAIRSLDERRVRDYLMKKFPDFRRAIIGNMSRETVGTDFIIKRVNNQLEEIYKQITSL